MAFLSFIPHEDIRVSCNADVLRLCQGCSLAIDVKLMHRTRAQFPSELPFVELEASQFLPLHLFSVASPSASHILLCMPGAEAEININHNLQEGDQP